MRTKVVETLRVGYNRMKQWYVAQVYAGYEEVVKKDLEKQIVKKELQEDFGEILVPSAKMKSFFQNQEASDEQLFPGYVLVEMEVKPATIRLVTSSLRVLKFLGGKNPIPLSKKEIDRIIQQMKGELVVTKDKAEFAEGQEVDIQDGPFAGFVGIIDKVDEESEKLTVMVSIFGRMTPVELGFNQVKR